MTKFFFEFKKPIFGPFPQFLGQNKLFKKIGLPCTTSKWLLAPWKNPEKSNDPIRRKHSGSDDGQTQFRGILPTTSRGLVRNIEYNVRLTNNYCITVSMQETC